ncbi:hypothetical protein MP228_008251 [Amoeboaphelidium protococcarum]|nr:hypothetical protein MP228_008251 [Amoeboaphelidium protococcarum]
MSSKIIIQLIIAGASVFGKAFLQAYQQALANGGKKAGQQAADAAQGGASRAFSELTRRTGLSAEEAAQILNVEYKSLMDKYRQQNTRQSAVEMVQKNYDHLFKVNDQKQGGSFYLQSKVVRAKERLEMELKALEKTTGAESQSDQQSTSK